VRDLGQLGGMEHGVDAGAQAVQQRGRQVRETGAVVARRGRVARRGARGRFGGRVEQQVRHVDRADAVDHAVMGLARQRPAPVLQPFEQHHLPQRLAALEPVRPELRGPLGELRLAAGRRQRRPSDVPGDVKGRVGHPARPAEAARRGLREPLAVSRHRAQPLQQQPADRLEGRRAATGQRVEDHHAPDVHVRAGVGLLELEEGGVKRADVLGHGPTVGAMPSPVIGKRPQT
jgi:hypothetical protein